MFSYRHAFHAGNHADVLKHMVLIQLLRYLNQKDKPYMVIDTHAGAGVYALNGEYASRSGEAETGIIPLWDKKDLPGILKEYVDLVKAMNPKGDLKYYPGSPYCTVQNMREQDRLRLFELHPTEIDILEANVKRFMQQGPHLERGTWISAQRANGFEQLKALLPPPSKRALVLIDPPYEDKKDYQFVVDAVKDAVKRFPSGMYAIWYPALQRMESKQLPAKLKQLDVKSWLNVTLSISSSSPDGYGLTHSGMFILNPPWTLADQLQAVMPYLVDALATDSGAEYTMEVKEG